MLIEIMPLLVMALGLGMIHALDADHIVAVSVLSSDRTSIKNSLRYAWLWAAGHGLVLLIMSLLFYQAGQQWPALISETAERLVGLTLIVLGVLIVYRLRRSQLQIKFHSHDGLKPHAHWLQLAKNTVNNNQVKNSHHHKAALLGGLHGMAGSAPLLISLPLVQQSQITELFSYVLLFSAGVFVAMVAFGGVLGASLQKLSRIGGNYFNYVQLVLALLSVLIGVRLVSA